MRSRVCGIATVKSLVQTAGVRSRGLGESSSSSVLRAIRLKIRWNCPHVFDLPHFKNYLRFENPLVWASLKCRSECPQSDMRTLLCFCLHALWWWLSFNWSLLQQFWPKFYWNCFKIFPAENYEIIEVNSAVSGLMLQMKDHCDFKLMKRNNLIGVNW